MTEPTGGELRRCPDCDSFILASAILNHRCERPSRTPMTRIEQIRQRADMLNHIVSTRGIGPNESQQTLRDVDGLLKLLDTRDAALRTLVEQLRARSATRKVAADDTMDPVEYATLMGASHAETLMADALDAILKETTHDPENSDRP